MQPHSTTSRKTVPAVCAFCGKEFGCRPYRLKTQQRGVYCSRTCANRSQPAPLADRFWKRVVKSDGCWLWTGNRAVGGYGVILPGGGTRGLALAHRVSWEIHFGPIPDGMHVLHKCDNPPCVNPAHLFLGTQRDNNTDKVRKGRQAKAETSGSRLHPEKVARGEASGARRHPERLARGERHGSKTHPERIRRGSQHPYRLRPELPRRGEQNNFAKLAAKDVLAIRQRAADGETRKAMAAEYGVDYRTIDRIVSRQTWRHI